MNAKSAFKAGVTAAFFGIEGGMKLATAEELEAFNEGLEFGKNLAMYKA